MTARTLCVALSLLSCVAGLPAQSEPPTPQPVKPRVQKAQEARRRAEAEAVKPATKLEQIVERIRRAQGEARQRQGQQREVQQAVPVQLTPRRNGVVLRAGNGQGQWFAVNSLREVVKPASSLVKGAYQKALADLDEARQAMATTENIDEAMAALDRAQRSLMAARAALWAQKDGAATKKTKKNGQDASQSEARRQDAPTTRAARPPVVRPVKVRRRDA